MCSISALVLAQANAAAVVHNEHPLGLRAWPPRALAGMPGEDSQMGHAVWWDGLIVGPELFEARRECTLARRARREQPAARLFQSHAVPCTSVATQSCVPLSTAYESRVVVIFSTNFRIRIRSRYLDGI